MVEALWSGIREISAAEWVAVAFALVYLVLAIRQNALCWAASIASCAIFLVLFARQGLVMQSWLQAFYVAMGFYGWWAWSRGGTGARKELPVSRWPLRRHLMALAVIVAVSAANGRLLAGEATGLVPYVDALTSWVSFFGTVLLARKVLENWLYWAVIDLVGAGLYFSQGLYATAVLFVVYSIMATRGYRQWHAAWRKAQPVEAHA